MVLKGSEDDGDVEYNLFGRKGRCESRVDAVMLFFSLFQTLSKFYSSKLLFILFHENKQLHLIWTLIMFV